MESFFAVLLTRPIEHLYALLWRAGVVDVEEDER